MLFDTLKHVKIMQDVGFGRKQSEAMVTIWSSVVESQFVTKQDLKEALLKERLITNKLFEEIRIELESLKSQMESKFDNLENRITIKLGSIMVGVIAVSKVLEKFF